MKMSQNRHITTTLVAFVKLLSPAIFAQQGKMNFIVLKLMKFKVEDDQSFIAAL